MIQFQNVKKSYGGIKVIEDFSLEVSDDQIFGLLGLPDTGKSTLVNLLMIWRQAPDCGDSSEDWAMCPIFRESTPR